MSIYHLAIQLFNHLINYPPLDVVPTAMSPFAIIPRLACPVKCLPHEMLGIFHWGEAYFTGDRGVPPHRHSPACPGNPDDFHSPALLFFTGYSPVIRCHGMQDSSISQIPPPRRPKNLQPPPYLTYIYLTHGSNYTKSRFFA